MRQFVASLLLLCLMSGASLLHAQFPFGRAPGFGPGFGMRPPMPPLPPMPLPGVYRPSPSPVVRVPGVTLVAPSRYIVPIAPTYGYYNSTLVVGLPPLVPSPYSAARVAVVQPTPGSTSVYRAGNASYRSAPANPTADSSASDELRPGMVLPDGAIVVSVGQPTASAGQSLAVRTSPTPVQPVSPTPAPVPTPVGSPSTTQSILESEEIPKPSTAGNSSDKPATKQF
jgi:hypothetical protein